MKIALAQINPIVGDIEHNAALIERDIERAVAGGAELVVFPELSIIGYPPRDLLLKPDVIDACVEAVQRIAKKCVNIAAIIGYPCPADAASGRPLYNAAAFCRDGQLCHRHVKSLLPTYDVFDEQRYFEPGPKVDITAYNGWTLGISICEDLWNDQEFFSRRLYHDNPAEELAAAGASVFINCSASPFVDRKHEFRLKLMGHVAKKNHLPLLYCNQVGGNDELIFDGNSCAFDSEGKLIAHAKDFTEDLLFVHLALPKDDVKQSDLANRLETPKRQLEATYHALVLGLRDYCRKCGFSSIVLGLSGGIDSAVTACVAVDALGAENVTGITMPSRYSSEGSKSDARQLAEALGIALHTAPIAQPHEAFERLLKPLFAGREPGVAEENVQARIRGTILMAFSNKFGALLVTTGNKSEIAVGYCTLYGDMAGGLAILSDVPKTMVYRLAHWINDNPVSPLRTRLGRAPIPENTISKPPSAELRENQKDEDSLPPYEVLDQIIERYVERMQSAQQIVDETQFDRPIVEQIVKLIDRNEYKRKQMPPGLKVTSRAFGVGRRMPIAQRYSANRVVPAVTTGL